MTDFERIDHILDGYLPAMERDLARLIAAPSVEGAPAGEGAPFGPAVRQALDAGLDIAGALGLQCRDLDGYCGYADLPGETEELTGVLGHLDVVPADAADWMHPPFAAVREDGRIYGRGTMDDKGPMIAALYGAKALCDAGVSLRKTVRFIFGCNEETGMACMPHYLACCEAPKSGFTPDGEFPLIVGEKGILRYTLSAGWTPETSGPQLLSLTAGSAANVIPAKAEAVFHGLRAALPASAGISIRQAGEETVISALGIAAHAAAPWEGKNALSMLLAYLVPLSYGPADAKRRLDTLAALLGDDFYGVGLGVAGEDALSRTTNAPTVCRLDAHGCVLTLDLRFQLDRRSDHYLAVLSETAERAGFAFALLDRQEPLYLGQDNPLAKKLLESYREVTGDTAEPLIIGGGTYAKVMPGFLAFGPEPSDAPSRAHQADEYITEHELLRAAKIYARAIARMAE